MKKKLLDFWIAFDMLQLKNAYRLLINPLSMKTGILQSQLKSLVLLFCFILAASATHAQTDPTVFSPNTLFNGSGGAGTLNGFDGTANTSDDFTYNGAASACPVGDVVLASMSLSAATCPGEYSTATLTINNQSGVSLSNLQLNLNLNGTAAMFNGEPYDLTTGFRIAEPNIFAPAYPAVANAISGTTGSQTLDIFTLPNGISTLEVDIVLGTTLTNLVFTVQQIPTSLNATGSVTASTTGITPGTVPTITGTPPAAVTIAAATLTLSYSTTGASSVQWTSGTNGSFANANAANTTYNISDADRANGYVDLNLQALSAQSCDAATSFRVNITGAAYDYGDAPVSYDLDENAQPVAAGATISTTIFLGATQPGSEATVKVSADATGDGAEEDGVSSTAIEFPSGNTLTIPVTVANTSGGDAYLFGFIDWNNDGDFIGDESEMSAMVTVAASGVQNVAFTIPAGTSPGQRFLRLRVSTDEFASGRSFGIAPNGEVEDYLLNLYEKILVFPKVFLEGPYNETNDNMDNALGTGGTNSILATDALLQPYGTAPWPSAKQYNNTESVTADFFTTHTDIVDWVLIELRDKNNPATIVARRAGLLKQNGDVVDTNGTTGLVFPGLEADNYYIAVRHRNHLGIMGNATVTLDATPLGNEIDFTTTATVLYGTNAAVEVEPGVVALHMGNANPDNAIYYIGSNNDEVAIGSKLGVVSNQVNTLPGYYYEDIDMSGVLYYVGSGNDQVLLAGKLQVLQNQNNVILEQLP